MRRKLLSLLLSLVMVLSLLPVSALAVEYSDADDAAWAAEAIDRWSSYGVVGGADGKFRPNANMTRAEAATVFANLLGLTGTEGAQSFADVTADKWYYSAIQKANAAGIINGSYGYMNPDSPVTREMFFTMFARALGFKPQDTTSGLPADGASWSAGYINALTDKGYVGGMDGKVNATANINRASVMSLLNQTITTYANENGKTYSGTGKGVMLVTADDCTITGAIDTLVIAGDSEDEAVAKAAASEDGPITATLVLAASKKAIKIENATINSVNVVAPATVSVGEGTTIETVAVTEQAEEVAVEVAEGAKVAKVETEAETTEISGKGEVTNVEATGAAAAEEATVTVTTPNTEVKAVATAENADGSKTVTITESKNDAQGASTGATRTETTVKEEIAADGTKTTETTVTETKTNAAGAVTGTTTTEVKAEEKADGSKVETATQSVTNAAGVTTTTSGTVTTSATGTVTTTGNNMTAAIASANTATAAAEAATGESMTSETPAGSGGDTTTPSTPSTPSTPTTPSTPSSSSGGGGSSSSETYSVTINLTDGSSPAAIINTVTLTSASFGRSASLSSASTVTFTGVPAGTYTIDVGGYIVKAADRTITISADTTKAITIAADSISKAKVVFDTKANGNENDPGGSGTTLSSTAGHDVILAITGAVDKNNDSLSGKHVVTVNSVNSSPVTATLVTANVTFTAGAGAITIPGAALKKADATAYELKTTIEGITKITNDGSNEGNISLTVAPAAEHHLAITAQPTGIATGTAGSALAIQGNPAVTIYDQYDNVVTTSSKKVKVTGNGGWTLGGTVESTGSSGVYTFGSMTATATAQDEVTGTLTFSVVGSSDIAAVTSDGFKIGGLGQSVAPDDVKLNYTGSTPDASGNNTKVAVYLNSNTLAQYDVVKIYADETTTTPLTTVTLSGASAATATNGATVAIDSKYVNVTLASAVSGNVYATYTKLGAATENSGTKEESLRVAGTNYLYTVTYNSNEGGKTLTGSVAAKQYSASTVKIDDNTSGNLAISGYTLAYWSTDAGDNGTRYEKGETSVDLTSTGSLTLYAIWKANATLTYDTNGGGSSASDGGSRYAGQTITLSDNYTGTKAGYTFTGWNTQANGEGTHYAAGAEYEMKAGAQTLYAEWTAKTYTLKVYANNGTDDYTEISVKTGDQLTAGNVITDKNNNPVTYTKADSEFLGWSSDKGFSSNKVLKDAKLTIDDTAATSTYASGIYMGWAAAEHTVTLTLQGAGANSLTTSTISSGLVIKKGDGSTLSTSASDFTIVPNSAKAAVTEGASKAPAEIKATIDLVSDTYTMTLTLDGKSDTKTVTVKGADTSATLYAADTVHAVYLATSGADNDTKVTLTNASDATKTYVGTVSSDKVTINSVPAGTYDIEAVGHTLSSVTSGTPGSGNSVSGKQITLGATADFGTSTETTGATVTFVKVVATAAGDTGGSVTEIGALEANNAIDAQKPVTVTLTLPESSLTYAAVANTDEAKAEFAGYFTVNNLPAGVSLASVTRTSSTVATLTFTGTPTTANTFGVTVKIASAAFGDTWDADVTSTSVNFVVAATYAVTFNTDGGSAVATQYVKASSTPKASKPATNPTKAGYVFKGWYNGSAATSLYDFENTTLTGDLTLTAKWNIADVVFTEVSANEYNTAEKRAAALGIDPSILGAFTVSGDYDATTLGTAQTITVSGTAYYVEGFTGFSSTKSEQSGHYVALRLALASGASTNYTASGVNKPYIVIKGSTTTKYLADEVYNEGSNAFCTQYLRIDEVTKENAAQAGKFTYTVYWDAGEKLSDEAIAAYVAAGKPVTTYTIDVSGVTQVAAPTLAQKLTFSTNANGTDTFFTTPVTENAALMATVYTAANTATVYYKGAFKAINSGTSIAGYGKTTEANEKYFLTHGALDESATKNTAVVELHDLKSTSADRYRYFTGEKFFEDNSNKENWNLFRIFDETTVEGFTGATIAIDWAGSTVEGSASPADAEKNAAFTPDITYEFDFSYVTPATPAS